MLTANASIVSVMAIRFPTQFDRISRGYLDMAVDLKKITVGPVVVTRFGQCRSDRERPTPRGRSNPFSRGMGVASFLPPLAGKPLIYRHYTATCRFGSALPVCEPFLAPCRATTSAFIGSENQTAT